MQNEVINILPDQENHVIGFADMGDLIQEHYPYRYAVVVGKRLDDAFKCRDACRKLSLERLDKKVSLCGICVSVCPQGKRS